MLEGKFVPYNFTAIYESSDPVMICSCSAIGVSIEDFEAEVNTLFEAGSAPLVNGYAPFCKHVFVPNFAGPSRKIINSMRSIVISVCFCPLDRCAAHDDGDY